MLVSLYALFLFADPRLPSTYEIEDHLHLNGMLYTTRLGYKVTAPEGWVWEVDADDPDTYLCTLDGSAFMGVTTYSEDQVGNLTGLRYEAMAGPLDLIKREGEGRGMTLHDVDYTLVYEPMAGAWLISYKLKYQSYLMPMEDHLVFKDGRLYNIRYYAPSGRPAEWSDFLNSFELVDHLGYDTPIPVSLAGPILKYGLIIGAIVLVGLLGFRFKDRIDTFSKSKPWEKAQILAESGKMDAAQRLFETAMTKHPRPPQLIEEYWAFAQARDDRALMGEVGILYLSDKLQQRDAVAAQACWVILFGRDLTHDLPTPKVIALAELFAKASFMDETEQALVQTKPTWMAARPPILFKIADLAQMAESPIGREALELLNKRRDGLSLNEQSRLDAMLGPADMPELVDLDEPAGAPPLPDVPPAVPPAQPQALKVRLQRVKPVALVDDTLRLQLSSGKSTHLPCSQIKTVCAGVVREAGGEPYLLVDLVLDLLQAGPQGPRVLRLDSRSFEIMVLFPGAGNARTAYLQLVHSLLKESGAPARPNHGIAEGKFPTFPSEDALTAGLYTIS